MPEWQQGTVGKRCTTATLVVLAAETWGFSDTFPSCTGVTSVQARKDFTPARCRLSRSLRGTEIFHMSALTAGPLYLSGQLPPSPLCASVDHHSSLGMALNGAVPLFIAEKQNSWDHWSSQIASCLPSYRLIDSKGEIKMFLKVLRSPATDTCHNTRFEHGGSVRMVSPMWDFRRIWKTEASPASWALLLWLFKVSLIFDLLSRKATVSAKKFT